jgi:hypothetical protein
MPASTLPSRSDTHRDRQNRPCDAEDRTKY